MYMYVNEWYLNKLSLTNNDLVSGAVLSALFPAKSFLLNSIHKASETLLLCMMSCFTFYAHGDWLIEDGSQ